MARNGRTGVTPLKKLLLEFSAEGKVTRIVVTNESDHEKHWPPRENRIRGHWSEADPRPDLDPNVSRGWLATLLAAVLGADMRSGETCVLKDEHARSIENIRDDALWFPNQWGFTDPSPPRSEKKEGNSAFWATFEGEWVEGNYELHIKSNRRFEVEVASPHGANREFAADRLKSLFNACPKSGGRSRGAGGLDRIAPPRYCSKYLSRPTVEKGLLQLLQQTEKPAIWMWGADGIGKRELAVEMARRSLELDYESVLMPQCAEPLTFDSMLREFHPQFRCDGAERADRLALALAYCQRVRTLIVVRHFDRVMDSLLIDFISRLVNSKALVLARKSPTGVQGRWAEEFQLQPLSPDEARTLIREELERPPPFENIDLALVERILEVAGRIPGAIRIVVEKVRSRSLNPQQLSKRHCSALLTPESFRAAPQASKRALYALSLFPHRVPLATVAQILGMTESQLDQALEPLSCYLTRNFASPLEPVREQDDGYAAPLYALLEPSAIGWVPDAEALGGSAAAEIRAAWFRYWVELCEGIGMCWDEVPRLAILDRPGVVGNLCHVLGEAIRERKYDLAIRIARGARYWQYVRGHWLNDPTMPIAVWLTAARAAKQPAELFEALVFQLNIEAKRGMGSPDALARASRLKREIQTLLVRKEEFVLRPFGGGAGSGERLSKSARHRCEHAFALLELAEKSFKKAERRWRKCLREEPEPHEQSAMARWLAVCLMRQGPRRTRAARTQFARHWEIAVAKKFIRVGVMTGLNLIEIDLAAKRTEPAQAAMRCLDRLRELVRFVDEARAHLAPDDLRYLANLIDDWSYRADWARLTGECLRRLGRAIEAGEFVKIAIDCYVRLGKDEQADRQRSLLSE